MIYGRQLLHSFLVTSMYTHTYIVSFYQQKDIFVFVGETYAHSNPLLILVNLCEVSSIHFITMMDHHWGGSWGGGEHIYIYIAAVGRTPPVGFTVIVQDNIRFRFISWQDSNPHEPSK